MRKHKAICVDMSGSMSRGAVEMARGIAGPMHLAGDWKCRELYDKVKAIVEVAKSVLFYGSHTEDLLVECSGIMSSLGFEWV